MNDVWKAYECLKDEGSSHLTVNHSLNFEDPNTGGESNMPRTGTSKDLFKNVTYRNGCGVNTMEMILLETSTLYEVRKDA